MDSSWLGIPLLAVVGGVMIGLAAIGLYYSIGRIAGISGIFFGALRRDGGVWRWMFLSGLILGAGIAAQFFPEMNVMTRPAPGTVWLIIAGLLVGWGTRLGNGCTSGHGVCGLGRLSVRSLASVITFMVLGMLTASLFRHWLGVPA